MSVIKDGTVVWWFMPRLEVKEMSFEVVDVTRFFSLPHSDITERSKVRLLCSVYPTRVGVCKIFVFSINRRF